VNQQMGLIVGEIRWDEKDCLLHLLRFERVDNLGAYSMPSETGLLIPLKPTSHRRSSTLDTGIL
jgi:hypothetical protein